MRELWTQDRVTFEGEFYRTEDAAVYDRPDEPVPVYVAAGGPVVARYAGRVADGFICTSGKGRELYADQLVPAVDEGLDKAGRAHDDIDRMIEVKVSWDPDPERALENTRFWAPLSLTAEQKHSIHSPAEMERAADELPIEQVAGRWVVASDHLVVHGPGHDQERFLSTFADQVLPGLRELVPATRGPGVVAARQGV
jgi:coenzyme F420-dependent glucose-6-phosphate dehydrogenase